MRYTKTYLSEGYLYWYDQHIQFWTIYPVDEAGDQKEIAEYYHNRQQLLDAYPDLVFEIYEDEEN